MNLLFRGCWGQDVADWQRYLIESGYDCGPEGADGVFGRATYEATCSLQSDLGIRRDGIVGDETRRAVAEHAPPPFKEPAIVLLTGDGMPTWRTPLVETPWPKSRIRDALVATYWSVLGLEMWKGSPSRDLFIEYLGPCTSGGKVQPWNFDAKKQVWTCALTLEGALRRNRIDSNAIVGPCPIGMAGGRTTGYAMKCGAWRAINGSSRPEPADGYVVGPPGHEHFRCVVGWEDDVCVTVDGGQVDPVHGRQCTRLARNKWVKRWGKWCEEGASQWHVTQGWYDVDAFGWRDELRLLPAGIV